MGRILPKPRPRRAPSVKLIKEAPNKLSSLFTFPKYDAPQVLVIGFGPIGQAVVQELRKRQIIPTIVEQNIDTVTEFKEEHPSFIYGDASQPSVLESAKIGQTQLLVITVSELSTALAIIESARHLNPNIRILVRVSYLADQPLVKNLHVNYICSEKETAQAFTDFIPHLLKHL